MKDQLEAEAKLEKRLKLRFNILEKKTKIQLA